MLLSVYLREWILKIGLLQTQMETYMKNKIMA